MSGASPGSERLFRDFADRGRQISNLQSYYKLHALIYDATRWSFLFGRTEILARLPAAGEIRAASAEDPLKILEVGCGTGKNLAYLARKYPQAELTGVDLSADMLRQARAKLAPCAARVRLLEEPYQAGGNAGSGYDVVLFSYSLSMINPQWAEVLDQARSDLRPGGLAAAVDFSDTAYRSFQNHMARNHVVVGGHLLPALRERFVPLLDLERSVYLGWWKYLLFIGRKA